MLTYLIAFIGLLLTIIGLKYSYRRLVVSGVEIDGKFLLAVGLFTLVVVILLKFFGAA